VEEIEYICVRYSYWVAKKAALSAGGEILYGLAVAFGKP